MIVKSAAMRVGSLDLDGQSLIVRRTTPANSYGNGIVISPLDSQINNERMPQRLDVARVKT